ncbi:MAG TPA: peptidoglycan-associated lipoprotein Pal [Gammaproteobacteria bacterium]|nr:peptidoglycan-associated lipoprotein Pal [Gammaproteobacteria bacterium]
MVKNSFMTALFVSAVLFIGGCTSSGGSKDGEDGSGDGSDTSGYGAGGSGYGSGAGGGNPRVIYFDFDDSSIRSEYDSVLATHAQNLIKSGGQVTIQGHTDERGSREYNMALGEARAHVISRYLINQGVSSSQISSVSYGEEQPESYDHNESAWARNRRAVLDY